MRTRIKKKHIYWTLCSVITMIMVFFVTLNYLTDYFYRSIVASIEGKNSAALPVENSTQQATSSSDSQNSSPLSPSPFSYSLGTSQTEAIPDSQEPKSSGELSPTSTPDSNQNFRSVAQAEKAGSDGNITTDEVNFAQENITLKDKAKVMSVLLKKLSSSDITLFVRMSDNGVTSEEKKQAKEIILKKLTEEEYNELIAIATKLGLSQGKNYSDSQKEYSDR
ncbi:hypothetical protein [Paenibacillus sp. HJGM_3]|uniref:hypothetical protein n=1 Tax=Paenibacillus sp. HJGM_3 TaxID=3379816 RepID=UPI00385CA0F8